jgi:hypothetical protein
MPETEPIEALAGGVIDKSDVVLKLGVAGVLNCTVGREGGLEKLASNDSIGGISGRS